MRIVDCNPTKTAHLAINHDRGVQDLKTSGINLNTRSGHALKHNAVLVEHLAKGLFARVVDSRKEPFESFLSL